jgi:hypothetical protein
VSAFGTASPATALTASCGTVLGVPYSLQFEYSPTTLNYITATIQKPTNLKTLIAFTNRQGLDGYSPRTWSFYKSTDGEDSWGALQNIPIPTVDPERPASVCMGYDSLGVLHICFTSFTSANTYTTKLNHMQSLDDGATWSAVDYITRNTSDGFTGVNDGWMIQSKLLENNGYLMYAYYTTPIPPFPYGGAAKSSLHVVRKAVGGTLWVDNVVASYPTQYVNESDLIALDNTTVLMLSRYENSNLWVQNISTDNGVTFSSQGTFAPGADFDGNTPPFMCSFLIKGVKVIALYFQGGSYTKLYITYAKASDFITLGTAAWKIASVTLVNTYVGHTWYGSSLHMNNNINAIGFWPTGYSPDDATKNHLDMITFPSTQLPTVITALGL